MGWAGIQRYAVTWTGDQSASWDYIRWHIPTLIGSGLSGQTYATGDVDAIFGGSPETYTRDLQWKAFTPVLMGMSGWAKAARKHPWWYDEPYRSINRDYLKLKMRLTPYMYTTAYQAEQTGAPIVRGLMWDYPQDPTAFTEAHKYQFLLGKDLLHLSRPVRSAPVQAQGRSFRLRTPEAFAEAAYLGGRPEQALVQLNNLKKRGNLDYYARSRIEARIAAITPTVLELRRQGIRDEEATGRWSLGVRAGERRDGW